MAKQGKAAAKVWGARVSPEIDELLRTAMFLKNCETIQDLLAPVIEDFARGIGATPEAIAALRSKQDFAARESRKLTSLPNRKETNGDPR